MPTRKREYVRPDQAVVAAIIATAEREGRFNRKAPFTCHHCGKDVKGIWFVTEKGEDLCYGCTPEVNR